MLVFKTHTIRRISEIQCFVLEFSHCLEPAVVAFHFWLRKWTEHLKKIPITKILLTDHLTKLEDGCRIIKLVAIEFIHAVPVRRLKTRK